MEGSLTPPQRPGSRSSEKNGASAAAHLAEYAPPGPGMSGWTMPYIQDAGREGGEELADLFHPAQTESGKGGEQARGSLAGT